MAVIVTKIILGLLWKMVKSYRTRHRLTRPRLF